MTKAETEKSRLKKCPHCERKYSSKGLARHIETAHTNPKPKGSLAVRDPKSQLVPPEDKKPQGRKLFGGRKVEDVLADLKACYAVGATDEEACCYADISVDALYRYCELYPDFRERKELLKTTLTLKGRMIVAMAMEHKGRGTPKPHDIALQNAWRYLRTKKKDEFGNSPFIQVNNTNTNQIAMLSPERSGQILEAAEAFKKQAELPDVYVFDTGQRPDQDKPTP